MLFDMNDSQLRETLASQVRQSQAHAGLRAALEQFPPDAAGKQVTDHTHTAWQQVEHMRLAAEDLVAYCRDPEYRALDWPAGYWPASPTAPTSEAWSVSAQRLLDATEKMARIVENPDVDLHATVPTGEKQHHNALRAALILIDHNSYHAAQLIALRQALNIWPVR